MTAHLDQHRLTCRLAPLNQLSWRPTYRFDTRRASLSNENAKQSTSTSHRYLWGNMPAIDVLKLDENEDEGHEKDINLLFAASGDLRNVIKTVADLSETFTGKLNIVINDRDSNVAARNALMLLMLMYSSEESKVIDVMIHLWYSALLTQDHINFISTEIHPLIEKVYGKTGHDSRHTAKVAVFPSAVLKLRLKIAFQDFFWQVLLSCSDRLSDLNGDEAQRLRQSKILNQSIV